MGRKFRIENKYEILATSWEIMRLALGVHTDLDVSTEVTVVTQYLAST